MLDIQTIEFLECLADRLAEKIVQKQREPEVSITTERLIELKRVTPQTICRWIHAGMPVEKGRPNRFYLSKVDEWLEKRG